MSTINLQTRIKASKEIVFDFSRSIDLHLESTAKTNEKAIAGVTSGLIGMGESVTWRAKHFGLYQNFTSKITQYEYPNSFTDEMQQGAFKSFKHVHTFTSEPGHTIMEDKISFESPFGLIGKAVNYLILEKYLERFMIKRNNLIKRKSESFIQH